MAGILNIRAGYKATYILSDFTYIKTYLSIVLQSVVGMLYRTDHTQYNSDSLVELSSMKYTYQTSQDARDL